MNDLKNMVDSWKGRKRDVKKLLRKMVKAGVARQAQERPLRHPRRDEPPRRHPLVHAQRERLRRARQGRGERRLRPCPLHQGRDPRRQGRGADRAHAAAQAGRPHREGDGEEDEEHHRVPPGSTRRSSSSCPTTRGSRPILSWSPGEARRGLRDGDLVAAKVTRFPEAGDPECRILKVFRALDSVKKITQFVTYKQGLSARFPRNVESEAKATGLDISTKGRVDLRATEHVTIDGELARDFDDAVCVEKIKNGYLLYVSIADVSHYVRPGSPLDREAESRGTSVYFPGSVIPMLPKKLSNIVCSLNPNEERMTVTARLRYDSKGEPHAGVLRPVRHQERGEAHIPAGGGRPGQERPEDEARDRVADAAPGADGRACACAQGQAGKTGQPRFRPARAGPDPRHGRGHKRHPAVRAPLLAEHHRGVHDRRERGGGPVHHRAEEAAHLPRPRAARAREAGRFREAHTDPRHRLQRRPERQAAPPGHIEERKAERARVPDQPHPFEVDEAGKVFAQSTRAISALPWTTTATSPRPSAATRTSSATGSSSTSSARGLQASRSTGKKSWKRWPATSPTGSAPRWKRSARRRTASGSSS